MSSGEKNTDEISSSSPKKRKTTFLTSSPSPTKSPSKFGASTTDYTGYIVDVSDMMYSESGNPFYDVKVKVDKNKASTIRFMVRSNAGVKRQSFIDKKNSCEPLTFTKLSSTSSGIAFFNSYRGSEVQSATDLVNFNVDEVGFIQLKDLDNINHGSFNIQGQIRWIKPEVIISLKKKGQAESHTETEPGPSKRTIQSSESQKRVREAIITDGSFYFPISIWEEIISIKENTWYSFTNVTMKYYNVKKLQTTRQTSVQELDLEETISWSGVPMDDLAVMQTNPLKSISTIQNGEIASVCVPVYPMCVNSKCSKKVQICPGDSFVKCNACDRKMLASKCPCGLICTVDIIHNEKQVCLTIFPEQLNKFFEEDVVELYANNPKELEEKILLLESISLSYNKKNIVIEINK